MKINLIYGIALLAFCTLLSEKSFAAYKDLSPEEQITAEKNYERFRQLPEDQKQVIKENWQRYQALPAQEKIKIETRFKQWKKLSTGQKEKVLHQARERALKKAGRQLEKKHELIKAGTLKRETHAVRRKNKANSCVDGKCERK